MLDLDPPEGDGVRRGGRAPPTSCAGRSTDVGLDGAVKTSGAKGVHVFVPLADGTSAEDAAAATRAIARRAELLDPAVATTAFVKADRGGKVFVDSTRAGGATVVAAYSPRARPGVPVSFPVAWDELDAVAPGDFTVHTALDRLGDGDPWAELMPAAAGAARPTSSTRATPSRWRASQAMHEGKRRARAKRQA